MVFRVLPHPDGFFEIILILVVGTGFVLALLNYEIKKSIRKKEGNPIINWFIFFFVYQIGCWTALVKISTIQESIDSSPLLTHMVAWLIILGIAFSIPLLSGMLYVMIEIKRGTETPDIKKLKEWWRESKTLRKLRRSHSFPHIIFILFFSSLVMSSLTWISSISFSISKSLSQYWFLTGIGSIFIIYILSYLILGIGLFLQWIIEENRFIRPFTFDLLITFVMVHFSLWLVSFFMTFNNPNFACFSPVFFIIGDITIKLLFMRSFLSSYFKREYI